MQRLRGCSPEVLSPYPYLSPGCVLASRQGQILPAVICPGHELLSNYGKLFAIQVDDNLRQYFISPSTHLCHVLKLLV